MEEPPGRFDYGGLFAHGHPCRETTWLGRLCVGPWVREWTAECRPPHIHCAGHPCYCGIHPSLPYCRAIKYRRFPVMKEHGSVQFVQQILDTNGHIPLSDVKPH
eukprot:10868573-Heterocapsa_arctica.AAC.1